jgi:hypothetical protein
VLVVFLSADNGFKQAGNAMTVPVLGAIIYGLMAFAVPTSNGECVLKARSLVDRQLPLPDGFKLEDGDNRSDHGNPSDNANDEESKTETESDHGSEPEGAKRARSEEIEELGPTQDKFDSYDPATMDSNPGRGW